MLTETQLVELKNKIEAEVRLYDAIQQVVPSFQRNKENMKTLKQQLFTAYPELKPEVQKLRIQHKIDKLENQKLNISDNDILNSINLEIARLSSLLADID